MSPPQPRHARIAATGRYVPDRVVTNAELEELLGEPVDQWLVANVGIRERHVMAADQTTSDLAVGAARACLRQAGRSPAELDLVIVATDTPDYLSPATASVVQAKLGARRAATFDVNCACAAWVTALDVASRRIATDPACGLALVVGAYGMTRFLDWSDKHTATLFADGAGAALLEAGPEPGFLAGRLGADGSWHDALGVYTGGAARPATEEAVRRGGPPHVEFARRIPAGFNTEHWPPLVRQVVADAGLRLGDVDLFVFTQLNLRTIEVVMAELGELAARTRPSALLYEQEFAAGARAVAAAGPAPALAHLDGAGLDGSRPYADALAAAPLAAPADLDPEDVACLLFTGGTTGVAKAAMVSYRMIAWNTLNTAVHELDRDDVTITHTPLFHTGGLLVYTLPLLVLGGTVVLLRAWDPEGMLDLVERERVTLFFCVPTQYQTLLASERFASADLSSLRFVTSGGAPLPVSVIERWRAVHDTPFKQGFGMTEFGPGGFSMGPEHAVAKAGSIGRPNWFVSAAVVDQSGAALPPGGVGELVLKGPSMFSGYFEDPRASAGAVDAGGWFHTGDLAYADGDGFYFIVDRKKDMFVSGGENVNPAEVERALCEHPAVLMCAVVGVPDERWGEVGRAFVVRRDGATADEEELLAFLRTRLARYKQPRSLRFVPELPISPQGKVLKRLLRTP